MLNAFLQGAVCKTGEQNVTSISGKPFGGKYFVPTEKSKEFFGLIATSKKRYKNGLVCQAKGKNLESMIVDLDFAMNERFEVPMDMYKNFMRKIAASVKEEAAGHADLPPILTKASAKS